MSTNAPRIRVRTPEDEPTRERIKELTGSLPHFDQAYLHCKHLTTAEKIKDCVIQRDAEIAAHEEAAGKRATALAKLAQMNQGIAAYRGKKQKPSTH